MRSDVLRHLWGVKVDIVCRFLHILRRHKFFGCDITSSEADWVAEVRESNVPLTAGDAGVGTGGDIGAVRKGYREGAAGEADESNEREAEDHWEEHLATRNNTCDESCMRCRRQIPKFKGKSDRVFKDAL